MARTDNLTNFLTDIANSIRNKKETTEPILATEFDNEINSLSSKYSPRQISFMGYEGTELDDELSKLDLSNVTNLKYMFYNCTNLESVDLSGFDIPKINSMFSMFSTCSNLKNVNIKNINTENVTIMASLFNNCTSIENLDLSNFDTSNVTNLNRAFFGCTNLKSLNLSSWNTSEVVNMTYMFANCTSLERLDIRNFDFSSVDSNGTYLMFSSVPSACLVIVKNDTLKTKVQKIFGSGTNIKTVAELTEEEL